MNYLVTGSNSTLAKFLIEILKTNNQVVSINRKKIIKKNTRTINIDLSKKFTKNFISKKIKLNKIDYVIHLAAIKISSKYSEREIIEKNLNITNNLILILKKIKFKKIINISSISVYPNKNGNFRENSKVNFDDNNDYPYALSKFICEKKLKENFKKNKILTLRVAQILGYKSDNTIIGNFLRGIKKNNKIEIFGNGKRYLNLIHINNLIRYILILISKKMSGTFNISDYSLSINKIAKLFKKKYGNNSTKIVYKNILSSNPKFCINTKKFFKHTRIKKPQLEKLIEEI